MTTTEAMKIMCRKYQNLMELYLLFLSNTQSPIPCSFPNPDNSIPDSNQNNQIPYSDPNPNNLTYTMMKAMHEDKVSDVAESIIAPHSIPISSPIPYSYSDISNNLISSSLDPILDYIPTFDNSFLSPN